MFEQQYKGVTALFCVFLVSMWIVKNEPELTVMSEARAADHFALHYKKVTMNALGKPSTRLTAEFAAHFRDSGETELTEPIMIIHKGALPPWVLRSESGIISADGKLMSMNGNVYIDRENAEDVRAVNIETRNLRVQPERNYAETDERAQLVTGLDTISGTGMKLFYQEPMNIELLANVKGVHVYE